MESSTIAKPQCFPRRRLAFWLGAGAALVACALFYLEFWGRRPRGFGPAGPPVPRAPFAEVWTERPVLLLGIGDSVTAGLGAKSPDHSYFQRIVSNPTDEFPELRGLCLSTVLPNLRTQNLAVSGSTSMAHIEVIREKTKTQSPDTLGLVVMTTGGNDLIHNYGRTSPRECAMYGATLEQAEPWITNFKNRLETMIDLLDERFPGGCHLFLADIYDPTDGVGDAPSVFLPDWPDGLAIHRKYNDIIHQCATSRTNVHLVPLHKTFWGHGSHCRQFWRPTYCREDPTYWFYDNIEDPNDRGYDAIRRIFLIAMIDVADKIRP